MQIREALLMTELLSIVSAACSQAPGAASVTGHLSKPEQKDVNDALVKGLRVAPGFHLGLFKECWPIAHDGGVRWHSVRDQTADQDVTRPNAKMGPRARHLGERNA